MLETKFRLEVFKNAKNHCESSKVALKNRKILKKALGLEFANMP